MTKPTLVDWKAKRLNENKKEPYCQVCLKLESIATAIGAPAKLCSNCVGHYHRDIKRGVI
ncbi:hypothetical protein FD967_03755 [Polynucleobacter sp. JS-Mosq-20-D10]|uniref:hypothetical protein n=1 Tax=Polynucleobacter TaxID=44013 RepID=UPI001BFE4AFF|nr:MULTISPECIES: hypothetical protein [Polynucleobacter]MBT8631633.1 hypothetical protein [Polynucleobacter paneuropaeus]QWE01166.1 hypothetical protein FD967_03755 [Polynucleobacter sp. JS-Mosq-20-D10]